MLPLVIQRMREKRLYNIKLSGEKVSSSDEEYGELLLKTHSNKKRKMNTIESSEDEIRVKKVVLAPLSSNSSADSTIGDVSDGELNDLIGMPDSHLFHKQTISSSDDDNDFIDHDETGRVLMPLQYRFVSNQEWFILYCQYLYSNDDTAEEAVEAKKRYEQRINHLLEQLRSQRWDESLAFELRNTAEFKYYSIASIEGCDVCRLDNRTSCFEIKLLNNSYYSGRYCLERTKKYHKVAHMIPNLKKDLTSMNQEYLASLHEDFHNELDVIDTYVQKGMEKN
eukprot:NODE_172_length_15988_cov_0.603940.p6 type:complete len:281 gc:universal NODE_172_length_15988_cov_0.603940:7259-8101(+)